MPSAPPAGGATTKLPTTLILTQLLPLVVFIAVDAFVTDLRISIAAAVVFAVGQLAVTWARSRRFEWFVLLDVGLIAGLGGVSIAFDDELFFKMKPAIMDGATIALVLGLVLAPARFFVGYFGRLMPGQALRPEAIGAMKSLLAWSCLGLALHLGLVLYTALHASKETWAFVSGPGLYLLLLPMSFGLGLRLRARLRETPDLHEANPP